MNNNIAVRAAALLRHHWDAGTQLDALPDDLRPLTRVDGYAVQAHVGDARPVFGWKIAATSTAGQQHINVAGPIAGRMFADTVVPDGGACSLGGNAFRLAEPEFAFRLAHDLPPRDTPYTHDETLAAVATLHPAIELPDSRFVDVTTAGEAQIIADAACARHFVLGPATDVDWRTRDLATLRPLARVGTRYTRDGVGAAVLGNPTYALAWLVAEVTGLGLTLHAGDVITTGTCCPPLDVRPDETLQVDFGPLGAVSVRFTV